jgi:cation diffusion facilitator family transporter
MFSFFINKFLKKSSRKQIGITTGYFGLLINSFIFLIELAAGLMTGSLTLMADSLHNLVDAVSSILTVISFKISSRPADRKYPFGFGRIEYLCSFLISLITLGIGSSFLFLSIHRLLHPALISFSLIALLMALLPIPLKLFYAGLNYKLSDKINSTTLKAVSFDAMSDICISSLATISLLAATRHLELDGYFGIIVSAFVIFSGLTIAWGAIQNLIGKAPNQATIELIRAEITRSRHVIGVHDIVVHDYGPGHTLASAHIEIPADLSLVEAHTIANRAELAIRHRGIELVIHIDPAKV